MVALPELHTFIRVGYGTRVIENRHQKDMWCNEIGFCAQDIDFVLRLVIYAFGKAHAIDQRE